MPWALCNTSSSILRADIVWKVSPQLDILFLGMISKKLLSLMSRSSEDLQHFVLFFSFSLLLLCRKLLESDILTDQHVQAVTVSAGLPREMRGSWAEARLMSTSGPGWWSWESQQTTSTSWCTTRWGWSQLLTRAAGPSSTPSGSSLQHTVWKMGFQILKWVKFCCWESYR